MTRYRPEFFYISRLITGTMTSTHVNVEIKEGKRKKKQKTAKKRKKYFFYRHIK
jgi:hypothetical protein